MNTLQNKTDEAVAQFFSKCMTDPEIDFKEFVQATSVALGSTIGLHTEGIDGPLVLDKAIEDMKLGADLCKQVKPVADILRSGIAPGVIVVTIRRKE